LEEEELSDLLFRYTDERWARRIAANITRQRRSNPINTTSELADIIAAVIPASAKRKSRVHPATKSFAAIRMAVNDEYWALEEGAWALAQALATNARLAILTYSSTEDRTVKRTFRRLADRMPEVDTPKASRMPRRLKRDSLLHALTAARTSLTTNLATDILPTDHSTALSPEILQEAGWGQNWMMKIITQRPLVPAEAEIENNPLSRSAKLRAIEKIALP
jgi:16S rRNA C1402 N4-methylase RsmH